ncbi:MAG: glycine--tRNA ligase [bacterium]|nr:glycine--tRNA ligase [bacterium]
MFAASFDQVVNLAKRRGFIFPGSEIYGGLANSWDYGPLGVELKNNIKQEWWKWFVHRRTDMVGLDPAIIMNPKVWEASGHLKHFADPLIECKQCHQRFRADDLPDVSVCPNCGAQGTLTELQNFNLLFQTFLGPVEGKAAQVYLRAELAQAMFVDFPQVLETVRPRLPFGIAAQGRVFRNEITPGNFIFRTREFDLMEFEYFVRESEWERWFDYWHEQMFAWLKHVGVSRDRLHAQEIPEGERAHYSKRTIDIEYDYPFGRKELYGLAYRGDFDLKNHMEKSGRDISYTDLDTKEKILPHVIEPTFGLDRTVLVALLEAYHEEEVKGETRTVLRLPHWMAPYKVAVLPLSKHDDLVPLAQKIYEDLTQAVVCDYDETQSIGRRYRRQDEIGTPYCITIDFDSLKDNAVTIRDRDSMTQERVLIADVRDVLSQKFS